MKTNKFIRLLILLAVIAIAVGLAFTAKNKLGEKTVQTSSKTLGLPVETTAVTKDTIIDSVKYTGTVVSKKEVTISPKIAGRIEVMNVREGDTVKKGQAIITLEKSELESKLLTLNQKISSAGQNLDYWEDQLVRNEMLLQEGVIPKEKFDQSKYARDNAANGVKEAYTMLQEAKVNLNNATITAPMDGVVTAVMALPGDLAVLGKPIIKIADVRELKAQVKVIEGDLVRIKEGSGTYLALTNTGSVNSSFTPIKATVSKIFPALDPVTRTAVVEVDIPQEALKSNSIIRPGMSIDANFVLGQQNQALVIPKNAVKWEAKQAYIFVAQNTKAVKILIKTGLEDGSKVEVLTGLKEGDLVIISNLNDLFDGREIFLFGKEKNSL